MTTRNRSPGIREEDAEEEDDDASEDEEESDEEEDEEYIPLVRSSYRNPLPPPPNSPLPILIQDEEEDEEEEGAVVEEERDEGSDLGPKNIEGGADVSGAGGDEPDTFACSVCMEPWTSVGAHRTCCLPCGHVYGRSCIERWIRQGIKSKCPQCNKKCNLSEIRNLYAPHIVVIDEDLQKELVSLRSENKLLKMQNASLLEEVHSLKKRQMEMEIYANQKKACLGHVPSGRAWMKLFEESDQENNIRPQNYSARSSHQCSIILKDEFGVDGARVFDIDASNEILIVARRSLMMTGVHMLTKISLLPPYENDNIQLPHDTKAVRDIHISSPPGRLALLASMGKKLSILSMESNNVVINYGLPVPAWSCSWDANSPHHVYAGLQNGMLMVFDLRQTLGPIVSISGLTTHPIHSIQSVVDDGLQISFSSDRTILTASSIGPCQWNVGGGDERPFLIPELENQGVCISLAYCGSRNDIVASFRPKVQISSDCLGSQASLSSSPIASRQTLISTSPTSRPVILGSHVFVKRVGGGSYHSIGATPSNVSEIQFPKSAIINLGDDYSLFAFGDEATHGVCLRLLPSFSIIEHLKPHPDPILDLKYACSRGIGLLGCISENRMQIFTCSRC